MGWRLTMRCPDAPGLSVGTCLVTAVLSVTACGTATDDVAVPVAARDPSTDTRPAPAPDVSASAPGSDVSAPSEEPSSRRPGDTSAEPDPDATSVTTTVAASTAPSTTGRPTASTTTSTTITSTTTVPPVASTTTIAATVTTVPTTTVAATITLPLPPPPDRVLSDPFLHASNAAFDRLARAPGASMTITRGGQIVFSRASGQTIDGQPATGDSPMVVASVSKLVVALAVARLHEQGRIDAYGPVPWGDIGLSPNPAWNDVTVRELLDHTSGLPTARSSWFTGEGGCRDHVPSLLTPPPQGHRGTWVYSNGNYCLLGLLVEQRTGLPLDQALQQLVFDPVGAGGVHLTSGGLQLGDVPHSEGVERLSRLGGAGTVVVSTDDTALAFGRLTPTDLWVLQPPGVFTDQYGWGHTGTVDGAKSCIWVLDGGDTVVSATIAGNTVSTGGDVCDIIVPAIATDLGIGSARPGRTP
ncbi:MAG: serine hydrolase [Ilumatobacter sp.]